jgi:hypothetical protein
METSEESPMKEKEKENTGENGGVAFEGASSLPTKAHYDSVKMKYFSSLGMKPPVNMEPKRERGSTAPVKYAELTKELSAADKEYIRKPISPARKRSVSTPLNAISKGIPIPGSKGEIEIQETLFSFDSDEEFSGEDYAQDEDNATSYRPGEFIPPHEMLKRVQALKLERHVL